jgi:hypothetical protein
LLLIPIYALSFWFCSILELLQNDRHLEREFESSSAKTHRLQRERHANTESMELLEKGRNLALNAIEACTTLQLVESSDLMNDQLRAISSLLPDTASELFRSSMDTLLRPGCDVNSVSVVSVPLPSCLEKFCPRKVRTCVISSRETMSLGMIVWI